MFPLFLAHAFVLLALGNNAECIPKLRNDPAIEYKHSENSTASSLEVKSWNLYFTRLLGVILIQLVRDLIESWSSILI